MVRSRLWSLPLSVVVSSLLASGAIGCSRDGERQTDPTYAAATQAASPDPAWCDGQVEGDCYDAMLMPEDDGWRVFFEQSATAELDDGVLRLNALDGTLTYAYEMDAGGLADGYDLGLRARSRSADVPAWVGDDLHDCADVDCPVPPPPDFDHSHFPEFEVIGLGFGALAQDRYFEIGVYDNGVFYTFTQDGVRPLVRLDPST